jgi:ABC-type oligopeptide transport system substrate-binding subunit
MNRHGRGWWVTVAALLAVPLLLAACGGTATDEAGVDSASVEQVKGTDIMRVKLTADAAKLLGVRTERVRSESAGSRTVIPYDAVLYDPDGGTWTYTSPKHLVYQRADIRIARIDGVSAVLTRGPPAGTQVVTAGAPEIWGVEYGDISED